jgi:hypothetical protein
MSVRHLETASPTLFSLSRSLRWWDSDTGCTLIASQPAADPDLWAEYLRGALRSYRKYGVERALDIGAIRNGVDTSLFFAAVDEAGRVVGGLRAKGPFRCADESHALIEWARRPGLRAVRDMIANRVPFGVVELKSAWTTDDPDRNRALTDTLARTAVHSTLLLNTQFAMATAASHVIDRWVSSGGVVASRIPATPYPDDRYRTKLMWWDRATYSNYAKPKQASKITMEMMSLTKQLHRVGEPIARQVSPV